MMSLFHDTLALGQYILFAVAFIAQFVGHRVGDYLFQTDYQAQNKATPGYLGASARFRHVLVYSFVIALLVALFFPWTTAVIVFGLTMAEHQFIDSRKPIIWWKTFLEKRIAQNKDFDITQLPFFVLIEIDQTVHYLRIFALSLLIAVGII